MFAYCGNNPVSRNDEGGEWWNVVIGAVVGAASTYISAKLSGEEVNPNEVLVSALCGAVSGALAATGFGGVAGQMITGAATSLIDSGYQNYNDYKGGEKSFGEALTCTLIDTGMGALFGAKGTDVPDATKALKTSNQIAASYHQAKKILKTTVLHPKTRAAANAVIKAGKKYFWKTAGSTLVESALDATVSVGFSKISELYVKAIG